MELKTEHDSRKGVVSTEKVLMKGSEGRSDVMLGRVTNVCATLSVGECRYID